MGVVLAGMLQVSDVTGDERFAAYTLKNFDFIFDHLPYFRAQAKEFGPQKDGYRRLLDMHELDDCGAIGAALVRAYGRRRRTRATGRGSTSSPRTSARSSRASPTGRSAVRGRSPSRSGSTTPT